MTARGATAPQMRAALAEGIRGGTPVAFAGFLVGMSFGVVAEPVMGAAAAIGMSALVFASSAQFAATAVLAAGGSLGAAVAAGIMLNLRFLPMSVAMAPWMRGSAVVRAAQSYALVDASWALSSRGAGRFDPYVMLGATVPQYPAWVGGTVAGALGSGVIGDTSAYGLDAVFPAFFFGLLWTEARRPGGLPAAVTGAVTALALVPFTPVGLPILAASLAALLGLRHRAAAPPPEALERPDVP